MQTNKNTKHTNKTMNSSNTNKNNNNNNRQVNNQTNASNFMPQQAQANNQNNQTIYEEYWSIERVQECIPSKTVLVGKIRINQRSYEDAFISDPNGGGDIYIKGLKERNRALNGDIVAVKLKEKYLWKINELFKNEILKCIENFENSPENEKNAHLVTLFKKNIKVDESFELVDLCPLYFSKPDLLNQLDDDWFQKTGVVVALIEKKNSRWAAGHLKLFPDKNREWALFSPNDSRIPRMKIRIKECPSDFYTNSQFYANTIFVAQIVDIPINSRYAFGELKHSIGTEGDIEVETEACLIENGVDFSDFDEKILESLPSTPWCIPNEEIEQRRDLRNVCIFTIDPATARDLDDALHCIRIDEDTFEVGVHIADVSYFVREDTPVDKCASERTTSVYLVQKVIPMLPRLLCEQLCSLNPSVDRLTFSVIWKIKTNGDIIDEWFGRTIINSAVKLSYDHAQKMIENPEKDFDLEEFPPIRQQFNLDQIKNCVLNMHKIALNLRGRRFEKGCLALNQVKINFVLNKECGLPYGYNVFEQKDSNRLVEEFMLLANIAVAHRIYSNFPLKSILRRHIMPNAKQLEQLGSIIKSYGYDCDISSSGSIQSFLHTIQKENSIASLTLTCLLAKTMQLAQYFCTGLDLTKDQFFHYGLAVPLYTHFTSPIRRYPDILVHRQLAASLGYCEDSPRSPAQLQIIADNCNDKKYSAKICSERSAEIFFALFVNECGPFEETGCVIQIKDHSFDVLIVNLGVVKRVYCDKMNIDQNTIIFTKTGTTQQMTFTWMPSEQCADIVQQTIELFSTINVVLFKHESDKLKFNVVLKHPREKQVLLSPAKLAEKMSKTEDIVNQRIDTDPYLND